METLVSLFNSFRTNLQLKLKQSLILIWKQMRLRFRRIKEKYEICYLKDQSDWYTLIIKEIGLLIWIMCYKDIEKGLFAPLIIQKDNKLAF